VIEVQHLTKRYGPFTAVDDISFKVERGEILGFLGPNGAGKTTTMRVLTGYMPPTDGKAVVAGYDVQDAPIEAKRRTGYLPETPPLYTDMSVRDYLTFCATITGVPRGERKARVLATMERTHVADMAERLCGKLSKGYRQRVGLAQALLHNPEVLILDEPTRGIDVGAKYEIYTIINQLAAEGKGILMISSEMPELLGTCDRIYVMNDGRIVAELSKEEASQETIMRAIMRSGEKH
jgi:ABC-2 type transport system ATP-binding protein